MSDNKTTTETPKTEFGNLFNCKMQSFGLHEINKRAEEITYENLPCSNKKLLETFECIGLRFFSVGMCLQIENA